MSPVASPSRALVLVVLPCAILVGCNDEPKKNYTVTQRSEVVQASGPRPPVTAPPSASTHAPKPNAPRTLCASAPLAAGKGLPRERVEFLAAGDGKTDSLRLLGDRWTWVNLWAAWCGPCKEEIPRLFSWQAKLAQAGTPVHLVFLSLDDDRRQALGFLESQPATGLRSSFWLPEGASRGKWLAAFRMKEAPELPVQLLFDAQGGLRCLIEGAVEEGDYASVAAVVSRR